MIPHILAKVLIIWGAALALFFGGGRLLIWTGLWPSEWAHPRRGRVLQIAANLKAESTLGAEVELLRAEVFSDAVKCFEEESANNVTRVIATRPPQIYTPEALARFSSGAKWVEATRH